VKVGTVGWQHVCVCVCVFGAKILPLSTRVVTHPEDRKLVAISSANSQSRFVTDSNNHAMPSQHYELLLNEIIIYNTIT